MTKANSISESIPSSTEGGKLFRAGTLTYTKASLLSLFAWLLWGDFCFTLMESVVPSILPLKLTHLGASNTLIGILITTLFSAMNFIMNPVLSFRSDRFRSRWGRRIPFLIFATPFIAMFLVLMAYADSIGPWLHDILPGSWSVNQITIALLALLIVGFQFFNLFVSSIYYYLFNDVVPEALLARFMSLFRVVGTLAGSLYTFFIFQYAENHFREIFLGSALLYLVVFTLMCLRVKEGKYPPPPPNLENRRGLLAAAKTYAVECFTHRVYWNIFFVSSFCATSGCILVFYVFFYKSLGLTLADYGKLYGVAGMATALLLYPAGILADRYHPIRISIIGQAMLLVITPVNLIFLFWSFTPDATFWVLAATTVLTIPATAIYQAGELPMFMRLLPRERYGQFSSAAAMVRSIALIVGGLLAGTFMDLMKWIYHGDTYYYRYAPLWAIVFQGIGLIFLFRLKHEWKKHGGPNHYVPPQV